MSADVKTRNYLIQRLLPPAKKDHPFSGWNNPFAFGGGYRNGGLSEEAVNLIEDIFTCDYMGAAEYEFGALPKSLEYIAKNAKDFVSSDVKTGKGMVYFFARDDKAETVAQDLNLLAQDKRSQKIRVRDNPLLNIALEHRKNPPKSGYAVKIIGGLNVTEEGRSDRYEPPFFYSIDKLTRDKFAALMKPEDTEQNHVSQESVESQS